MPASGLTLAFEVAQLGEARPACLGTCAPLHCRDSQRAAVASKAGISTRSANSYGSVWHQVVVTRICAADLRITHDQEL